MLQSSTASAKGLKLQLFGPFQVLSGLQPLPLPTKRTGEMLARLALARGRPISRRALASEIWWNAPDDAALTSLRKSLSLVRKQYGEGAVTLQGSAVLLGDEVSTDLNEVTRALSRSRTAGTSEDFAAALGQVERMTELPLLDNWASDWIEPFREEWNQKKIGVLAELADFFRQHGQPESALKYATRAAHQEPLLEAHAARVIGLLGELNRVAEAEDFYRTFSDRLEAELDLSPSPSLVNLVREVRSNGRATKAGAAGSDLGALPMLVTKVFEAEPAKMLPILASQGLSWHVYAHAHEVFPLFVRTLEATDGWGPERKRLAIDTIQLANFLGKFAELGYWLSQLADGASAGSYEEAVCCAMTALSNPNLSLVERRELCAQAQSTAVGLKNDYLHAVVGSIDGAVVVQEGHFDLGVQVLQTQLDSLESDPSQRGRKYLASILANLTDGLIMTGQIESARRSIERALVIESVAGVSEMETGTRARLGFIQSLLNEPGAIENVVAALAAAVRQRNFGVTRLSLMFASGALAEAGHEYEAARVAATGSELAAQFSREPSNFERLFWNRFLGEQPKAAQSLLRELSLPAVPAWVNRIW